jgi:hypothetical protein
MVTSVICLFSRYLQINNENKILPHLLLLLLLLALIEEREVLG